MGGHTDRLLCQRAMKRVKDIYPPPAGFPCHEFYGLGKSASTRGCFYSEPSSRRRRSKPARGEFRQFIGNARESLAEVEAQPEIAKDLEYIEEGATTMLLLEMDEISRMLAGLRDWSGRKAS
jgi:four helix bundle protein